MGNNKTAFPEANRTTAFVYPPEKFVLVDDPAHPLFDPRIHNPLKEEFVQDVMVNGIIEPVVVRKNGDCAEVVDGRQRVKAALEANRRYAREGVDLRVEVPFIQRKADDATLFGITVSANEHRTDDTALVRAEKARKLLDFGKTEKDVARSFGVSIATLRNILALLELCTPVRNAVERGELSPTAAAKMAPLSHGEQKKALDAMREQGGRMTASRTERVTKGEAATPAKRMQSRREIEKMRDTLSASGTVSEYNKGFLAAIGWVLDEEQAAIEGECHESI